MVRIFMRWDRVLTGDFSPLWERANDVRRIACLVRGQLPWMYELLYAGANSVNLGQFIPLSRAYWGRLCRDTPIPPANRLSASPPFFGGQCAASYNIFMTVNQRDGAFAGSQIQLLTGPIQTLHAAIEPLATNREEAIVYYRAASHAGGNLVRRQISDRGIGLLAMPTFTVTRPDGLPDSCGNRPGSIIVPASPPPPNITVNTTFNNQTRPVTVSLPDFQPGNWPNFEFRPTLDIEGGRYEFLPDGLSMDFEPAINLQLPGNAGGNQVSNIQNTVGAVLDIVNNIQQNPPVPTSPSMSVSLPFAECGSQPVVENLSGELPTVLGLALSKIATNLDTIGTRICDNVAVVPEWWQTRPGQRSQLVIQFAGLNADGKENRNRWSLVVPHYRYGESQPISLPIYQKGRFFACLTLDDNSKIWVNAKTQALAVAYVRRLSLLVKPALLPNPLDIHSGERRGTALVEMRTRAVRASYFSTGQKNMSPDWVKSLR